MNVTRMARAAVRPLVGRDQAGWRFVRAPALRYWLFRDATDCLLHALLASRRSIHVVQIGANDGRHNDPLWTFRSYPNLSGLLVEPFEPAFRRLRSNYGPWLDRFTMAQVAVSEVSGMRSFYHFSDSFLSAIGGDELSTLDEGLLRRHAKLWSGAEQQIRTTSVRCITFEELCAENSVSSIEALLLDAEGHDYAILRNVDFTRWRVSLVIFEHSQLSAADSRAALATLAASGFDTVPSGGNTIGVRRDAWQSQPVLGHAWAVVQRSVLGD